MKKLFLLNILLPLLTGLALTACSYSAPLSPSAAQDANEPHGDPVEASPAGTTGTGSGNDTPGLDENGNPTNGTSEGSTVSPEPADVETQTPPDNDVEPDGTTPGS